MAKQQRFIGLTELEPSVVTMITNVGDGPIRVFATTGNFPALGAIEKLYIASDTNMMYLWDGTTYVLLSGGGGGEEMANIFEYANLAAFPATGAIEKLYIAKDTNLLYRWNVAPPETLFLLTVTMIINQIMLAVPLWQQLQRQELRL